MDAAELQNDGWWVAYVQLTRLCAVFQFRVRVEPDKFTVQIGDSKQRHTILDGHDAALEAVYQEACDLGKQYFESGLQRFFDETGGNRPRKIGFV